MWTGGCPRREGGLPASEVVKGVCFVSFFVPMLVLCLSATRAPVRTFLFYFILFMLYAFFSARSCATSRVSVPWCIESVTLLPKYAVFIFPSCCDGGPTRLRLCWLCSIAEKLGEQGDVQSTRRMTKRQISYFSGWRRSVLILLM